MFEYLSQYTPVAYSQSSSPLSLKSGAQGWLNIFSRKVEEIEKDINKTCPHPAWPLHESPPCPLPCPLPPSTIQHRPPGPSLPCYFVIIFFKHLGLQDILQFKLYNFCLPQLDGPQVGLVHLSHHCTLRTQATV